MPPAGDLALGLARPLRTAGDPAAGTCRVIGVIDGDTVDLWCGAGPLRLRLAGYDSPELFSPRCPAELAAAVAAKWHLRGLLWRAGDLAVALAGTDRYGRSLGEIVIDTRNLSGMMIAAGHGRAYDGGRRAGWCG